MIITAHFATLKRAVQEARKYGVTQTYEAVRQTMTMRHEFTHHITHDRTLTIMRGQGRKRWKLAVDVVGRVVPVKAMPKAFVDLLQQPQYG
jgi:hypothetical protein